ncbi:MAG: restriction endonuclease [Methanotrichaceae archaeon]
MRRSSADRAPHSHVGDSWPIRRPDYDDSTATLRPLLARIEETDQPIDEIVYIACGLTDAEIAMVEEAAG